MAYLQYAARFHMQLPLIWSLRKVIPEQNRKLKPKTQQGDNDLYKKNPLICCFCRHLITSLSLQIEVNGKIRHTFKNPHGIVFDICCYAAAAGCLNHGEATREFTWFPGFSWRLALCSHCYSHLGWYFQGESQGFYGLIADNILESDD